MSIIEDHKCRTAAVTFFETIDITPTTRILLALSGGPDSTALLAVLKALSDTWNFHLSCAYIDHGLRTKEERKAERKHIDWCRDHFNVPIYYHTFQDGLIAKYADAKGCGLEAAARKFRYAYLDSVRNREAFDYIAFGHNSDDHVETVVIRFLQGSGAEGLAGIPAQRGKYIRPFLKVNKGDILDLLRRQGLPFTEDSTNESMEFQRNAVRHTVLPAIEEVFPYFRTGVHGFSQKMEEISNFIRQRVDEHIPWEVEAGDKSLNKLSISWKDYVSVHPVLRKQAVYECINALSTLKDIRIPYRFVEDTDQKITEKRDNGHIFSGYGVAFSRCGDILYAETDVVFPEKKGYLLVVDTANIDLLHPYGFQIKKKLLSSTIDYEEKRPFVVRSWRSGDVIAGKNGRKEVRKLFQEWDVPDSLKWDIPIIEDKRGIKAVLGSVLGCPDRYAEPPQEDISLHKEKG